MTAILKKASLFSHYWQCAFGLTGCVSTANENSDANGEVSSSSPAPSAFAPTPLTVLLDEERHHCRSDADDANVIARPGRVKAPADLHSFGGPRPVPAWLPVSADIAWRVFA